MSTHDDHRTGEDGLDPHPSAPRELLILYATETGTAQETADRIARECRRVRFHCRVQSMDAYPPETLISEHLVIFVVSTTGWGAEPRAMTSLWNMLLRSDLPDDLFEDMCFCVFGLGDTAYEKFCWPAKKLSRRMQSLGGYEICSRGEGDEQHRLGVDGALDPWVELLLETLIQLYPLPHEQDNIPAGRPPPRVSLSNLESGTSLSPDPLDEDKKFHTASVKCNRRITAEDWFQDVRHFEFSFEDSIKYNPGDVAVIHPSAAASEVDSFLATMGWENAADDLFTVEHTMLDQTLPDHLPRIVSLRILFTRYLDFNAVPRRSFFQLLRYFATDELEREKLDEFVSIEGADEMYDYCQRVKRTIWEVLSEFRSARIPREYVFDLFPPLRPREFSIASSIEFHPRELHLCVAIVRYRTKLKIPRKGVCTSYLSGLTPGDALRIGLRKGFISLPTDPNIPVMCVGPGTGIAPMRAVIQQRIHEGYNNTTLYFGCRSAHKDQHYHSEWESHAEEQKLRYRVACSRDGPEGVKRTYVQDLMQKDAQDIWNMLGQQRGILIISGSSNKMPTAVREAVRSAVERFGGRSNVEAVEYVAAMEREGRLIEECWS
ncbi:riboflavin synthase domain-like protein [Suillus clintonianus]|uniref:riboflavin synthase domain-like protein n=1 Tax=Suillus clintonianus TaxID=1904413 RepID=UPI001B8863C1|nr:riboflavin synthase domain-like protein [Suillus clintonianus]KAG2137490.1 riboflavin synthase domain-like protein [Suillus clintonianus]